MRALTLACAVLAAPACAAEPYPFEGIWDCQVSVFAFTADTYDTGSEDMPILAITPEGNGHILTFDDNYQLSLTVEPADTLHWLSLASGDDLTCKRQG